MQYSEPKSIYSIYKNLGALCLGFFFIFSEYTSLEGLQSTIHDVEGLGLAALMTVYASYSVSFLFALILAEKVGDKWVLVSYISFSLSHNNQISQKKA